MSNVAATYSLPTPEEVDALVEQAHELRMSDTRRALELSQQARRLALRIDYQRGLAYSLYLNNLCHFILADGEDLLEESFQVLSLFEGLEDQQGAARVHNQLALVYSRQNRMDEALKHLVRSLETYRQLGDVHGQSTLLNNIGVHYRDQAQYALALENLFEALRLAESITDPNGAAYALANITQVYVDSGEKQRALEYGQRGLKYNHQTGDLSLRCTLLVLLGDISSNLEDHETAIANLQQALALSDETGNMNDRGDALLSLGQAFQNAGQHQAAEAILGQALETMRQLGSCSDEADVLRTLGCGRQKQGDLQAALEYLEQALEMCHGLEDPMLLAQIHLPLSEIYEALGNYPLALAHHKAYSFSWEIIHNPSVTRRVQELTTLQELRKARQGDEDGEIWGGEPSDVLKALKESDQERDELLNRLRAQAELLEQLAREDGLTGVTNRRWLDLRLGEEFERAQRFGHDFCVALLDLDDFKMVNDRFSHQAGDRVLIRIARLVRSSFRTVDVVGRYGGEEFMLVMVEASLDQALAACTRVCAQVAALTWADVHPALERVTLSIGVADSRTAATPEQLVALADEQLYCAKRQGKNQVCAIGMQPQSD